MNEVVNLNPHAYWDKHELHRQSVDELVDEFVGWKPIIELVNFPENQRDKVFLSSMFQTGGRVSEVLRLRYDYFLVLPKEKVIRVSYMPLLKRYKKVKAIIKEDGSKGWETEKLLKHRKPFSIDMREPITNLLTDYLSMKPGGDLLLFPSPSRVNENNRPLPLTRFWAYKFVRKLDSEIPPSLKENLGLNKKLFNDAGEVVKDTLNLWCHWFRAQRASQLRKDYKLDLIELLSYFSWERQDTALKYTKTGYRDIEKKMKDTSLSYD